MKTLLALATLLLSLSSFADCSRYYIIYIENQTDGDIEFEVKDKEYVLRMDHLKSIQRLDLQTVIGEARTPVPSKCQFFINGYDLIKTNGESNLTRIYKRIANDGTKAPVDLFALTHGDTDGTIEVVKEVDKHEYLEVDKALMNDIPDSIRDRLGVYHNASCYGISTNLMGTKAGFAASVGSDDTTLGPLVLREFLRGYLNGLTLKETAEEILHACVNNEEWRQTVKHALSEDDIEAYCNKAIVAIVGNPNITVNDRYEKLQTLKKEHFDEMKKFGTEMDGKYGEGVFNDANKTNNINNSMNSFYKPTAPYKKNVFSVDKVGYTQQYGSNTVGQVDIDFKNFRLFNYVSIDNLNFSNKGIVGGQISVLNDGTLQAGVIKRDYAKGILFQVNIISLKKTFLVAGGSNEKGLSWQYVLSGKSNLGYLMLRDKNGGKRHFAHIGATIDNELNLRYKNISLETNTGYDFILIHPLSSPFYSKGSLNYNFNKSQSKIGGYADYNSVTGFNAGVTATIDLDVFKKKKKRTSR